MDKVKNVAIYIRLSNEDSDLSVNETKMESNSISNQRDLLLDYINNHEELSCSSVLEFCDDGYSGTNFERPAVQKLLENVKKKEIACIVVKDFSRFGRNYLELGDYLEQVFPFLGIRFISVNDGYDSARDNGITAGLDIGLKNLIYDLYSKDLSQKVKSGKFAKMKKGEYVGSYSSYGYIKDNNIKNHLLINKVAAAVIKKIFKLACGGKNTGEIAKILNEENVPSPAEHFKKLHKNKKFNNLNKVYWSSMAVNRILKDEIYLGKTINHKRSNKVVGVRNNAAVPRNEWIIVENTHEAIINEADFNEAKNATEAYKERKKKKPVEGRVLYSKVRCAGCGKCLVRSHTKRIYYKCSTTLFSENTSCTRGKIYEDIILKTLLEAIRKQALLADNAKEYIVHHEKKLENEMKELLYKVKDHQSQIERLNAIKIEDYEKYIDAEISKDEYLEKRDKLNKELEKIHAETAKLKETYETIKNNKVKSDLNQHFKGKRDISELTRELVDELVEAVYVYGEKNFEIVWRFKDVIG